MYQINATNTSMYICCKTQTVKSLMFATMKFDPSAGSPTETLLRLLLPLKWQAWTAFSLDTSKRRNVWHVSSRPLILLSTSSVVATGGVYKGQGRIQRKLMTYIYKVFLVHELRFQSSIPEVKRIPSLPDSLRRRITMELFALFNVARVRPRISKGIQTCYCSPSLYDYII